MNNLVILNDSPMLATAIGGMKNDSELVNKS